jgi:hypothetical protein
VKAPQAPPDGTAELPSKDQVIRRLKRNYARLLNRYKDMEEHYVEKIKTLKKSFNLHKMR